ncbi:MAG: hypothetical protein O7D30_05590, partial [Rickettsia endosymbiont of Ixodes persulcatus]|nr:hypothetical protein [Rickettsia endosymbiont of Ixodes persulcatus]
VNRERPDVVWKIINEVINRTKVSPSIGELKIDGQVMSDESLAETLANFIFAGNWPDDNAKLYMCAKHGAIISITYLAGFICN